MRPTFTLKLRPDGLIQFIWSDDLADLLEQGDASICRASHVEPTDDSRWTADMSPVGGPMLGPYSLRKDALAAEVAWLKAMGY